MKVWTTNQAAEQLGVTETTIRNWIQQFGSYMSETVRSRKARKHCTLTEGDMALLEQIASLSRARYSYAQIQQSIAKIHGTETEITATLDTNGVYATLWKYQFALSIAMMVIGLLLLVIVSLLTMVAL
jgi:hypothetical protein